MKKRIVYFLTAAMLMGTLTGCGSSKETSESGKETNVETNKETNNETSKEENAEDTVFKDVELNEENFPDQVFREGIAAIGDKDQNGKLSQDEIGMITILFCDKGESDLKGIEYLTELKEITIQSSTLTNVDLSKNKKLTTIDIATEDTELDFSGNPSLYELILVGCENLTKVNLSENEALGRLVIGRSGLTTLDLSKNPNITFLQCENNQMLETIDASGSTKYETIMCTSNKNLHTLSLSQNLQPGHNLSVDEHTTVERK